MASHPATIDYLETLVRRMREPAQELVLGPRIAADPQYQAGAGKRVAGVTTVAAWPLPFANSAARAFERSYRRAFPTAPPELADGLITHEFYDGVAAVLSALEAVDGDGRLVDALAKVTVRDSGAELALDDNRNALVRNALLRIVPSADGTTLGFEPIRSTKPVDQTLGGVLRVRRIGPTTDTCATAARSSS
jgi:ABC-type branched-subunit amino acid transport system substrate-binding protein